MSNIDSQLNDAIRYAARRYAREMQERLKASFDLGSRAHFPGIGQVIAASNILENELRLKFEQDMLENELRLKFEQVFQRVNDLLDNGDFMAHVEVKIRQAWLRERN